MRRTTSAGTLLGLLLLLPVEGRCQETLPREMSLPEAIRIAEGRNPALQADLNNTELADWNIKAAYGALLPSASASSSLSWQGSGEQQFGSVTLSQLGFRDQPSYYFSSYRLGVSYTVDGRVLLALPQAWANREAQVAQGMASMSQVAFQVTQAYLDALRQEEGFRLARQELDRAEGNLRLVRAQQEVGSGTPMDVRQAEVAVGRARVSLLTAENATRTAKLRLAQQMGHEPQDGFTLTSTFELMEPRWNEEELLDLGLEQNPNLQQLGASLRVQEYGVKMARAAYFPTLSLSAGTSGFAREASDGRYLVEQAQFQALGRVANCQANNELYQRLADPLPTQDCSRFLMTEAERRSILNENDAFPFDFTRQPPSVSLSISLPIFEGRRRQRDLEAARIAQEDVRLQLRDQELRLKTEVATGLGNLRTAYEAALIEAENQVWADEQLRLAQERYRLGAATFLELVEAETVKARADRERIAAVFAYHDALASLEVLVGANLRSR